jgi:hypothetical protein
VELEALSKFKDGACDYNEIIAKLKKTIEAQQIEIEGLKTADIMVGGLPTKVYKKLEHVNA